MMQPSTQANNAQQTPTEAGMNQNQMGILGLNNMTYSLAPDLSVCVQKNVQSSFFNTASYAPGATMVCVVNSGSAFVNLRQSYLVLDVQNTSTGGTLGSYGWFGLNGGSAANFINRISFISRSGTVIERIDNANQLSQIKVNYQYDNAWRNSVGSMMGVISSATDIYQPRATQTSQILNWASDQVSTSTTNGATIRFAIPLYVFSTFCGELNSLCPAQLLAGSRFEILLESASNAMMDDSITGSAGTSVGNKALNYQVVSCRMDFESYVLTDAVQRVLNQEAATRGLEVVSATTSDTQAQRTSSMIAIDVSRSCNRALQVVYKERPPKPATTGVGADSAGYLNGSLFDPVASAVITNGPNGYINLPTEWQVRAGQLYFPQTSLRNALVPGCEVDLYAETLRAFQKLHPGSMGERASANSSIFAFRGNVSARSQYSSVTLQGGRACFAVDLQRSAVLTSGIPLSNSRQLSIVYSTTGENRVGTFNYLVDVFLTYQILVRTFLSQAILET